MGRPTAIVEILQPVCQIGLDHTTGRLKFNSYGLGTIVDVKSTSTGSTLDVPSFKICSLRVYRKSMLHGVAAWRRGSFKGPQRVCCVRSV
jgi:hypothetical protein